MAAVIRKLHDWLLLLLLLLLLRPDDASIRFFADGWQKDK